MDLKVLNSLRLRIHRHDNIFVQPTFTVRSSHPRKDVGLAGQVVSLHFILLPIKTPDDHSITCSVLNCTYFSLSEPTPYSHLPPQEPTGSLALKTKRMTAQKRTLCSSGYMQYVLCSCSCEIQQTQTPGKQQQPFIPRKKREKPEPTPQTRKTTTTLTPSASSPPAQSPHQAPSPPPPTA